MPFYLSVTKLPEWVSGIGRLYSPGNGIVEAQGLGLLVRWRRLFGGTIDVSSRLSGRYPTLMLPLKTVMNFCRAGNCFTCGLASSPSSGDTPFSAAASGNSLISSSCLFSRIPIHAFPLTPLTLACFRTKPRSSIV